MNTKYLMSVLAIEEQHIERLEVHSFEMNIYLVKLTIDGKAGFVYDKEDRPMRFHNSQMVRLLFDHCDVATAVMIHDSPYDEMIGNPIKTSNLGEVPFSMQQPY